MISITVLSTSAGVAMLAVIILLVVTNMTIPAILVCMCVVRNKTGERQAAAPAYLLLMALNTPIPRVKETQNMRPSVPEVQANIVT